jgi:hypothetical protein
VIQTRPPTCLTLFRIGCELCERGDVEAGQVLLQKARELAGEVPEDAFNAGLLEQIDARVNAYEAADGEDY